MNILCTFSIFMYGYVTVVAPDSVVGQLEQAVCKQMTDV